MSIVSKLDRKKYISQYCRELYVICFEESKADWLDFRCNRELLYVYSSTTNEFNLPVAWDDNGLKIVPLWECGTNLFAMRCKNGCNKDFIKIDYEDADEVIVISESYQGLIAYLIYYIVEDMGGAEEIENTDTLKELAAFSKTIGFRYLIDIIEFQKINCKEIELSSLLIEYTRSIKND